MPINKVVVNFYYLLVLFPGKVDAVISFFVEQQDAPVVKYLAASVRSVIYSILIDNHDAKRFMVTLGAMCQESRAYRINGSVNACCTYGEIVYEVEAMVKNKDILLRKYGELMCLELPANAKKNIDRLRAVHHLSCGRMTVRRDRRQSVGKSKNWKEGAYQKEKERQNAVTASRKQGHYVYYIQWDNDPGFVKIGYSSSPAGRIAGFLTGNPRNLQVLRLEPVTSAQEELARHSKFDEYRHAREWFRYEGALREYVQSLSVDPAIELWQQLPVTSREAIKVEYF